jgi:protein translocase SEC61 complex gamma subunit
MVTILVLSGFYTFTETEDFHAIDPLSFHSSPSTTIVAFIMSSKDSKDPITLHIIEPLYKFAKESQMLLHIMAKPNKKEFLQIALMTTMGLLIFGFIGFFVKLSSIPIRSLLRLTLPDSLSY